MNEILLQTIIEKLEALEIALLKQNAPNNNASMTVTMADGFKQLRSEMELFARDFRLINESISHVTKRLKEYNFGSQQIVSTRIEHKHQLHNGIWISAGLLFSVILLSWGWLYTYQNKKAFKANDIKYRALKMTGNKPLLELLHETDTLYDLNQVKFREFVVTREQQSMKQAELLRIADENKNGKK